jgi:NAD(P)-dependent dehydrogenase (short-subunit alcohol dehydrogenase family)
VHTVLVLGGYGNFGAHICRALAKDENIRVLIAGRDERKARRFAAQIGLPERCGLRIDAEVTTLARQLRTLEADTLINTAGPFQQMDYRVAHACIEARCNYIDLADAREFVAGIGKLDAAARAAGVLVSSGASSVPALSGAVVDRFLPQFSRLDDIRHGIASGAKTPGLATLRAVLGYCGKPFTQLQGGRMKAVYGWQDLQRRRYPKPIGMRWLGSCDVPDLVLFPQRYPGVRNVSFHAGLGAPFAHLAIWALSWLVRWRVLMDVDVWSKPLHWISRRLEAIGTRRSAMHVELSGIGLNGQPLMRTWYLLAFDHHGPHIPCGAAIALARKLARGDALPAGAMPCIGLLSLEEYLEALAGLNIRQVMH